MPDNGDALYVWQVREPDGRWSTISALLPGADMHMPLIHRSRLVIMGLRDLANSHAVKTGQKLRLARFELVEVLDG